MSGASMKRLCVLLLIIGVVSCSKNVGPDNNQDNDNLPHVVLPDPQEWVPIFRFDGSAAGYCYPDEPSSEHDGRCISTFDTLAPVYWEGQWCSSNNYKLAFWIWYGWQQECMIGQGSHGNDWEHVILNFTYKSEDDFELESVTYYQHSGWYTRLHGSEVNVWVGKIGHGNYHCRCDGTGFLWDPEYCMGGCGYWDDFRNDSYGIQWKPTNLKPLEDAKTIDGPIGDRVKNEDYCDISACAGSSARILGTAGCWQNNMLLWPSSQPTSSYDAPLFYECSDTLLCASENNSKAITSIYSVHDNSREDRIWTFGCTDLPGGPSTCEWTDYLNDWDGEINYTAPDRYFISGFASYHSNDREDRRWKVKICKQEQKCCTNGVWTDFLNDFDAVLVLQTEGKVICGIGSYHNNDREDRQWRFLLCDLMDCE